MKALRSEHKGRKTNPNYCVMPDHRVSYSRPPISLNPSASSKRHEHPIRLHGSNLHHPQQKHHHVLLKEHGNGTTAHYRGRPFEPIDLDMLCTSSSLSDDDELLRDVDSGEPIDLDADCSPTAAVIGGKLANRPRVGRRPISFYSTSDLTSLTTSDSEIQCQQPVWKWGGQSPFNVRGRLGGAGGEDLELEAREGVYSPELSLRQKRGLRRTPRLTLANKFPSLSTIYPDNSSLSYGGGESDMERVVRKGANSTLSDSSRYQRLRKIKPREQSKPMRHMRSASGGSRDPRELRHTAGGLAMIQEISPVLPPLSSEHDTDLPPVIQPLKMSREWRPLQTSTATNLYAQVKQPAAASSVHPYVPMQMPLTPPLRSLFAPDAQDVGSCPPAGEHQVLRPEHFNLPSQLARHCNIRGILFLDIRVVGWMMIVAVKNAAYFNHTTHGSSFHSSATNSLNRRQPRTTATNYIAQPTPLPQCNGSYGGVSSCVKVELRQSDSHSRKRSVKYDARIKSAKTCVVTNNDRPEFFEEFRFRVSSSHLKFGDKLMITVYYSGAAPANVNSMPREVLGKMSFSLRKLFRKAQQLNNDNDDGCTDEPVRVCSGGYFLLPERTGSEGHLSQDNILHRKYYDEIGSSISTTASSSLLHSTGSPLKVMGEPSWPTSQPAYQLHQQRSNTNYCCADSQFPSSAMPPPASFPSQLEPVNQVTDQLPPRGPHLVNGGAHSVGSSPAHMAGPCRQNFLYSARNFPAKKSADMRTTRKASCGGDVGSEMTPSCEGESNHLLEYTTTASSSSNSGVDYKRKHRFTLPSITTTTTSTTDTTTSDLSNSTGNVDIAAATYGAEAIDRKGNGYKSTNQCSGAGGIDLNLLHPASPEKAPSTEKSEVKSTVRRVASFSFSTDEGESQALWSKQLSNRRGTTCEVGMGRKFTLGPIGKTLSYIRHKVDAALSTSTLYPTREECRQWQESFSCLLNHKYGCLLFREFIKLEFSLENLEFWLECEEYKRMREGKKSTLHKARSIYDTYIREGSTKEVNLDSVTRTATRTALEAGIRPDTFNMAQSRVEQLMAKDSYPRFLKSDYYLELVREGDVEAEETNGDADPPPMVRSASAKEPSRKFLANTLPARNATGNHVKKAAAL